MLLLLGLAYWLLPAFAAQAREVIATVPEHYSRLRDAMLESSHRLVREGGELLPDDFLAWFRDHVIAGEFGQSWGIAGGANGCPAASRAGHIHRVFARQRLAAAGAASTLHSLLLALSPSQRFEARKLILEVDRKVGAFVRGQGIVCVTVSLMSLAAYLAIGLPGALFLAVVAGVLEAVPMLGPVLGAVPPLMVAASEEPQKIIWVLLAAVAIQQTENYFLVPRIMDKSVGVNPMMTLLGIAGFGALFGLLGAVLAIPLAAILQSLLDHYLLGRDALEPPVPVGRENVDRVRYQTQKLMRDLRLLIRKGTPHQSLEVDEIEESIEGIASDLQRLLAVSCDRAQALNTEAIGESRAVTP